MNKPRVLGIGINVVDIYLHQKKMYPGGNEFNVAYNAAIQGAETGFLGVFADDKAGELLERTLIEVGVDTSYSHHETGSSGYALVDIRQGDRYFLDWNREGVTDLYPIEFTDEEIAYIKTFDVVSISRASRLTVDKIRKLSKTGISISYDFYDDFTEDSIREIAPYIAIGFLSCSHLKKEETRMILKKCVEMGAELAVGTRGSASTIAYDGKQYYEQSICEIKATDTMGAGDSFISAFLVDYYSAKADEPISAENKIADALQTAAKFAAEVVTKDGSLGIGYDVDPDRLSEIIHINNN